MDQKRETANDALLRDMEAIRKYVNSFVTRGDGTDVAFDIEDLYQEAYAAYLEACEKYDPSRGADRMTWASRPIYWAVQRVLRNKETKAAYMKGHADPEEEMDRWEGCAAAGPEDGAASRVYVARINRVLKDIYDHYDARSYKYGVLAILAEEDGATRAETAERLGVSTSYLAACRARVKDLISPMFEKGSPMETFTTD